MIKPEATLRTAGRAQTIPIALVLLLAGSIALEGIGLSPLSASVATAGSQSPDLAEKSKWQERYRTMLQNQARLRSNAALSRENYARAQRRNYPRGGARQKFILDAEKAEAELVKVIEETEELLEQARRAAVPRNWFYEVDDEDLQAPAASATDDESEDDDDREGRNPLYLDE